MSLLCSARAEKERRNVDFHIDFQPTNFDGSFSDFNDFLTDRISVKITFRIRLELKRIIHF